MIVTFDFLINPFDRVNNILIPCTGNMSTLNGYILESNINN